jgi:hypothetical protein
MEMFGRFRLGIIRVMLVVCVMVGSAATANALSEWWTPAGARCPLFDSSDACQAYCSADSSRCGGSSECTFRTGPTRPMCAPTSKKPESARDSDGWQGPGAR